MYKYSKINILYVAPSLRVHGGITTVIKNYLNSDLSRKYCQKKINTHIDGPKILKIIVALVGLVQLTLLMIFCKYEIVHIHTGDEISCIRKYLYFKIAKIFNCKVVIHFHGASFMDKFILLKYKWKRIIIEMFSSADIVICLSVSWKNQILKIAPKTNIAVLNNSVPLPSLRKMKNLKRKSVIEITFLGLIGDRKGIFDLLKVVKKLFQNGCYVHLNIGGNGDIKRLKSVIKEYEIDKHVTYLGWVTGIDKDKLLRKTDIYVLPSYGEGMPMSVLEAMSYGIAVVSTNIGGIPELVENDITGLLINPGNLKQLYQKIEYLCKYKKYREELGKAAREKIKNMYDIDTMVRQIDTIYQSII